MKRNIIIISACAVLVASALAFAGTEKEKKQYEEYLKKQESKPSFFTMDEPKEKKVTAWYTPDIPVNVGPLNYWGLPGLILEIQEEKRIILCSKAVISNKENFKIILCGVS